jgi:hypothetical protein
LDSVRSVAPLLLTCSLKMELAKGFEPPTG